MKISNPMTPEEEKRATEYVKFLRRVFIAFGYLVLFISEVCLAIILIKFAIKL